MKITIDTERKELTIADNTNLQELFEWCTEHLNNWSDYTIKSETQQTTTYPLYPNPITYPTVPNNPWPWDGSYYTTAGEPIDCNFSITN